MRRIAVINQKGGVGKTTSTVNIGMALARAGHRVLLIDLDPQAHLTLHLGQDPSSGTDGVYEMLTENAPLDQARQQIDPNLWLVGASIEMAAAEVELVSVVGREVILRDLLDQHVAPGQTPPYDYVLMDCPPSLGVLTLNGLCAASEVFIPLQPHYLALQGLGKLLETVSLVSKRINPGLKVSGVIVCMNDAGTKLASEVVDDARSFFTDAQGTEVPWSEARVFQTVIRRNIKLAESPSHGLSIFDYAPDSNGAKDYARLALEIHDPVAFDQLAILEPEESVPDDADLEAEEPDDSAIAITDIPRESDQPNMAPVVDASQQTEAHDDPVVDAPHAQEEQPAPVPHILQEIVQFAEPTCEPAEAFKEHAHVQAEPAPDSDQPYDQHPAPVEREPEAAGEYIEPVPEASREQEAHTPPAPQVLQEIVAIAQPATDVDQTLEEQAAPAGHVLQETVEFVRLAEGAASAPHQTDSLAETTAEQEAHTQSVSETLQEQEAHTPPAPLVLQEVVDIVQPSADVSPPLEQQAAPVTPVLQEIVAYAAPTGETAQEQQGLTAPAPRVLQEIVEIAAPAAEANQASQEPGAYPSQTASEFGTGIDPVVNNGQAYGLQDVPVSEATQPAEARAEPIAEGTHQDEEHAPQEVGPESADVETATGQTTESDTPPPVSHPLAIPIRPFAPLSSSTVGQTA